MNLRCIDVIESLTKERIYEHNDTSRDGTNCYYLRGDDGVKRFYLKSRFEEVKGVTNKPKLKAWELEEGKIYESKGKRKFSKFEGRLIEINKQAENSFCLYTYNMVATMEFTEINPNKERIEELKKLIKDGAFELENLNKETSIKDQLINSYEAELKELEPFE